MPSDLPSSLICASIMLYCTFEESAKVQHFHRRKLARKLQLCMKSLKQSCTNKKCCTLKKLKVECWAVAINICEVEKKQI